MKPEKSHLGRDTPPHTGSVVGERTLKFKSTMADIVSMTASAANEHLH